MKKLNRPLSPTSGSEVKKVYKEIQKGGDVPIGGLGIPYPEKKGTTICLLNEWAVILLIV